LTIPQTGAFPETTVPAFFSAIQFAQANNDLNILSTPNLLTLDNQEAEIQVGQRVQVPSTTQPTTAGTLPFTTFTSEDVTLSLKIKPQINDGGTVRLEVTQEDRELLPPNQQIAAAAGGGGFTTSKRSIKTAIVANNGQTVVLGGLIKDKNTTRIHKVPLLGDIPILGYLFKTKRKEKQKVNLVVFLTPHIIQQPRDFLAILQKKINEQNNFIEENFGKGQQKQIRKTLAKHASHLLQYSDELAPASTPGARPSSVEEQFPMELAPPPPIPGESSSSAPPTGDEDIDLAY
jgi:general secretion pathway protein D